MRRTFIIEVPDVTLQNFTPAQEKRAARKILREMDSLIRGYWRVGPRSKLVVSRIEETGE